MIFRHPMFSLYRLTSQARFVKILLVLIAGVILSRSVLAKDAEPLAVDMPLPEMNISKVDQLAQATLTIHANVLVKNISLSLLELVNPLGFQEEVKPSDWEWEFTEPQANGVNFGKNTPLPALSSVNPMLLKLNINNKNSKGENRFSNSGDYKIKIAISFIDSAKNDAKTILILNLIIHRLGGGVSITNGDGIPHSQLQLFTPLLWKDFWAVTNVPVVIMLHENTGNKDVDNIKVNISSVKNELTGVLDINEEPLRSKENKEMAFLPAGGDVKAEYKLPALPTAGVWTLDYTVSGSNIPVGTKGKVTIHVRDYWLFPFVAIMLGVIVSWIIRNRVNTYIPKQLLGARMELLDTDCRNFIKEKVISSEEEKIREIYQSIRKAKTSIRIQDIAGAKKIVDEAEEKFKALLESKANRPVGSTMIDGVNIDQNTDSNETNEIKSISRNIVVTTVWIGIITLFIAGVTGMLALYANKDFGNPTDYWTALLWGFGSDVATRGVYQLVTTGKLSDAS